jgi:hypothetical protein
VFFSFPANERLAVLTDVTNFNAGCLSPEPLPPDFPLEKTVQLCILDPTFPELVGRVDAALQQMHL